jgi:transposase
MNVNALFTQALGMVNPWEVVELHFDPETKRLDIRVDFAPGSTFPCPECSALCKVHDTSPQTWRHLNFFEHLTFIEARQPRTKCDKHGVKTAAVPWARAGSGFTLLFEAMVVELARNGLTVAALARIVGEHDTRLWRVLDHYVDEARSRADYSDVRKVGVDETSRQKGHVYVTLFADMEAAKVLFVTEGKDHETIGKFKTDLVAHGGGPEKLTDFSLDMSQAFIKGLTKDFEHAHLTFDKFHVIQLMNDALDEVRRKEQKTQPELKGTRYAWLRNEDNGPAKVVERGEFDVLKDSTLKTARAYRIKTTLQGLYSQAPTDASLWFTRWYFWATHSRLEPVIRVAKTLKTHQAGLMRWFESGLSNGLLEGINSLVQSAKARARGFRTARKMKTIIYLLLSKLDFKQRGDCATAARGVTVLAGSRRAVAESSC